jgi:hypothetical protein
MKGSPKTHFWQWDLAESFTIGVVRGVELTLKFLYFSVLRLKLYSLINFSLINSNLTRAETVKKMITLHLPWNIHTNLMLCLIYQTNSINIILQRFSLPMPHHSRQFVLPKNLPKSWYTLVFINYIFLSCRNNKTPMFWFL